MLTALLQTGRLFAGLVAIWQIVGLLPTLTWLANLSAVTPYMVAIATVKVVVLLTSGLAYVLLTRRTRRKIQSASATMSAASSEGNGVSQLPLAASPAKPAESNKIKLVESQSSPASPSSEQLWATALAEVDGSSRRLGLWARLFSESNGDSAVAKAQYLKVRVAELEADLQAARLQAERAAALKLAEQRAADQQAFDALPLSVKGRCPNCGTVLLQSAKQCSSCKASFEEGASWRPQPIGEP